MFVILKSDEERVEICAHLTSVVVTLDPAWNHAVDHTRQLNHVSSIC